MGGCRSLCVGILFQFLLLIPSITSAAGPYTITDLGDLPGGDDYSRAYSINNVGQVVGWSRGDLGEQAFVWQDGVMTPLPNPPGTTWGQAYDINESGQVVGGSSLGAVLWDAGAPTLLPLLPGAAPSSWCAAVAINNAGRAVGKSPFDQSGSVTHQRAVYWENGAVTNLGDPPGSVMAGGMATGINASGQIVCYTSYANNELTRSFLWEDGTFTNLGMLDGTINASALEINDLGQVIGTCMLPGYDQYRAFLWEDGVMTDLGGFEEYPLDRFIPYGLNNHTEVVGNYGDAWPFYWDPVGGMQRLDQLLDESAQGWVLREAYGINDAGQIVGWGYTPTFAQHAFLLTPVPEPAGIGLVLILAGARWRRR